MKRDIAIIDVFSLLHRAYYALPRLTASNGEVTNAVYGVALMLWRIFEEDNPTYIAAALDLPGKTFRHHQYPEYKANRKEMPDELRPQVERIKELLQAFQIPFFGVEGYEADDVIGTISRLAEDRGFEPRIYTGDRDALQLASDQTVIMLTKRGITEVERYNAQGVEQRYAVTPAQLIEVKALMGDASDNIPGIKGIGEKTALKLVTKYGNLEAVLSHLDELPTRQQNLLTGQEEMARLCRELATIDRQVPVTVDWDSLRYNGPDPTVLRDLFTELEFHNLLAKVTQRYPEIAQVVTAAAPVAAAQMQLVATKAEAEEALQVIKGAETVALVLSSSNGQLQELAIGTSAQSCFVFGVTALQEITEPLAQVLEAKKLLGLDLKGLLETLGEELALNLRWVGSRDFDLQLASYLINPTRGNHTLDEIVGNFLGQPLPPEPTMGELVAAYFQLQPLLTETLHQDELWELFQEVELPLSGVLGAMEQQGILVDRAKLQVLSQSLGEKLTRLEEEIYGECGQPFNLNSPKQLGEVLFDKMGLPPKKKTKTGYSTSAAVLEELAIDYPFVQKILDYRQYAKLKSTYADALADLIGPDGRIHTTFNQTITATGRLSSTNPNLQNIPIRTEEGRKIREVFIAAPGFKLVSLDYSQIELRVLAHLSGDENMQAAFQAGADIHTRTAAEVFGVAEVTSELRSRAKAINFGIIYGISPFGLARDTGISVTEAAAYIDNYFLRYPKVKAFLDEQVAFAQEHGYVKTILQRRRYLPDIQAKNRMARSFAERTAMNTPIQGSAADIIKVAMLKVAAFLQAGGWQTRMLLQIHDELVFEVPVEEVTTVVPHLQELMSQAIELSVPLQVDAKGV